MSGAEPLELHLTIQADGLALDALAEASGLSRGRLKDAMTKGAVWISRGRSVDRLRRASARVTPAQVLHLYYDERILAVAPPEPRLIADEGAYSVWFKPYGMLSQGSKWGDHCTLGRWSERHLQPQRTAFTVHRLDRAASGLMLLAHGKAAAAALSRSFRERAVEKRYQVIVHGLLAGGEHAVDAELDGKPARSLIRGLRSSADRTLAEVRIESGRKHQIRRHLAGLGHPVVGDRLHGTGQDSEDLQLVAVELAFACPETGAPRRYELPEALRPRL